MDVGHEARRSSTEGLRLFLYVHIRYLTLLFVCFCLPAMLVNAASDASLIWFHSPVVDFHLLPTGGVRLYTQQLEIYDALPTAEAWIRRSATVGGAKIRRISQVLRSKGSVLAFGQIVSYDGVASVVLRSTDLGETFVPSLVGVDTLAITDGCSLAPDGSLNFVDRVGRLWCSTNDGATWVNKRLPRELTPGSVREVDMIDANTGVCVDALRGVHFTTDSWNTQITPLKSAKPILRTQPSMINTAGWVRTFLLLQNYLYLTEAGDVYRTASNDLLWERWDTVTTVAASADRKKLAYHTTSGKLMIQSTNGHTNNVIDSNALLPYIMRLDGETVITYRPDTGPVIYRDGRQTMMRPLTDGQPITEPTLVTSDGKWGIHTNTVNAVDIDIVHKDGRGLWHRDTVARIGPIRSVFAVGNDSVIYKTGLSSWVYRPSKKTIAPYTIERPLEQFLKHPVVRFRLLFAADELDSSHVQWVEYVTQGSGLVCAELVDSSRTGVKSKLIRDTISHSVIQSLLENINLQGEQLPSSDFIALNPSVLSEFYGIIDTIFSTDAYFDQYDLYIPPPAPEQQARECREKFAQLIDELPSVNSDVIAQSFMAFRHVPHDGHSKYIIEFQNRAGRIAHFTVERTDEAHPPLMLPWRGYADGRTWFSYNRGLAGLFNSALPEAIVPAMFKDMSRDAWFLVGVASYLDGLRYGRRHRWSNRIVTPAARW